MKQVVPKPRILTPFDPYLRSDCFGSWLLGKQGQPQTFIFTSAQISLNFHETQNPFYIEPGGSKDILASCHYNWAMLYPGPFPGYSTGNSFAASRPHEPTDNIPYAPKGPKSS